MQKDCFDLLGVKVADTNMDIACATVERWLKEGGKRYICVAPVSTIVDAQFDNAYRTIINNADMVTPDGVPLVWCGRLAGHEGLGRVSGADFMARLFTISEQKGYRHYFYGGMPETLEKLKEELAQKHPDLKIAGCYAPPFRKSGDMEDNEVLERINALKPDFVWIGLGSPKQDVWMANHRHLLDVPIIAGVGAAFDFLAGVKPRAPQWMRSIGLEWFFRLCCEPRRLWKRYLVGNSIFIFLLVKQLIVPKKNV